MFLLGGHTTLCELTDAVRSDGSLTRPGKNDPVHFHLPDKLPQGRGAVRTMRSSPGR